MRTALLAVTATALITLSACGSSTSSADKPVPPSSTPSSTPSASSTHTGMDMEMASPTAAADPNAARSTVQDAQNYAVQLEQVFFSSGYPTDLSGALAAAKKLDLTLSPGNTIATYVYDSHDKEFQLCVENTDGAHSTYDTRPMTTIKKGDTGGCPGA